MKTILNKRMNEFIKNGSYIRRNYNESTALLQARMNGMNYHYSIETDTDILTFTTKEKIYTISKKDFDWKMLYEKLDNVPTDDNGDIEEEFEHFDIGSSASEIWHWFEWFFDISLGEELYK